MKWWTYVSESSGGAFTLITLRHGYKVALLGTVLRFASWYFSYLYRDEAEMVKLFHDIDYWGLAVLLTYFFGIMIFELVKEDILKNDENKVPSIFLAY